MSSIHIFSGTSWVLYDVILIWHIFLSLCHRLDVVVLSNRTNVKHYTDLPFSCSENHSKFFCIRGGFPHKHLFLLYTIPMYNPTITLYYSRQRVLSVIYEVRRVQQYTKHNISMTIYKICCWCYFPLDFPETGSPLEWLLCNNALLSRTLWVGYVCLLQV